MLVPGFYWLDGAVTAKYSHMGSSRVAARSKHCLQCILQPSFQLWAVCAWSIWLWCWGYHLYQVELPVVQAYYAEHIVRNFTV